MYFQLQQQIEGKPNYERFYNGNIINNFNLRQNSQNIYNIILLQQRFKSSKDSNSKYIKIYFVISFSYVTLHFVVPEKLGFLVSMLFDAKLTLTILASSLYLHRHTRAVAFCCTSTLIAHNIHAFKYILMV